MDNDIQIGDLVKSKANPSLSGKVISIEKSFLIVESEKFKFKLLREDVTIISSSTDCVFYVKNNVLNDINLDFNPEIDLHGLSQQEAIEKLDKFIDSAIITGHSFLKIIHGKGMGVLRNLTKKFFSEDPRVKAVINNNILKGGSGVTWIELK